LWQRILLYLGKILRELIRRLPWKNLFFS